MKTKMKTIMPVKLTAYIYFLLFLLIFLTAVYARPAFSKESYKINNKTMVLLKKAKKTRKQVLLYAKKYNFAFDKGEILTYKVSYINMINAGKAILSSFPGLYDGKKVIILSAQAYSAKWLKYFYYVHDETESFFSPLKCYPYFLIMKRHEGSHRDFMEEKLNASYESLLKNNRYKDARKKLLNKKFIKGLSSNKENAQALYKNKTNAPWKPYMSFKNTQDALSALYFLRLINFRKNTKYYIPVYENRKDT